MGEAMNQSVSRREEIRGLEQSIRFAARGRSLMRFEKRRLAVLAAEASVLDCEADELRRGTVQVPSGRSGVLTPRDESTYPASMRPGARGND